MSINFTIYTMAVGLLLVDRARALLSTQERALIVNTPLVNYICHGGACGVHQSSFPDHTQYMKLQKSARTCWLARSMPYGKSM